MDALFNSLTKEGVMDSQGSFTLNSEHALKKLRSSALGDPNTYALAIYRALVCSGAREIRLRWDLDDLWFDTDLSDLPYIGNLASPLPKDDPARLYMHLAIVGAMSMNPQFLKFRTPSGSWQYTSFEQQPADLTDTERNSQIQLRRRLGKTFLWSLGRRLFKEKRELEILRARCTRTAVSLRFKGEEIADQLELKNHYETRKAGKSPRIRLSEPGGVFPEQPPLDAHAVFWPEPGAGSLRLFVAGAEVKPLPLPGSGFSAAVSALDLPLDLSQEQVAQDRTVENLLFWIEGCKKELIVAHHSEAGWSELARTKVLESDREQDKEFQRVLEHLPLFHGRSVNDLRESIQFTSKFSASERTRLKQLGVKFLNTQLREILGTHPEARGEMLLALWKYHDVGWALVPFLSPLWDGKSLPEDLLTDGLKESIGRPPLNPFLSSVPQNRCAPFAEKAMEALLQSGATTPGAALAYLECGLLLPDPASALRKPERLTELQPSGTTSIRELFEQFSKTGNLSMHTGNGEGFLVTPQMGQRVYLGLRGEAVILNGEFCADPLSADNSLLFPVFERDLEVMEVYFTMLKRTGEQLICPLCPEGDLRIDLGEKLVFWNEPGKERVLRAEHIQSLCHFHKDVQGDDKTHHYFFITFSDGTEHYYLKGRGRTYDTIPESDRTETMEGHRTVLEALRRVAASTS